MTENPQQQLLTSFLLPDDGNFNNYFQYDASELLLNNPNGADFKEENIDFSQLMMFDANNNTSATNNASTITPENQFSFYKTNQIGDFNWNANSSPSNMTSDTDSAHLVSSPESNASNLEDNSHIQDQDDPLSIINSIPISPTIHSGFNVSNYVNNFPTKNIQATQQPATTQKIPKPLNSKQSSPSSFAPAPITTTAVVQQQTAPTANATAPKSKGSKKTQPTSSPSIAPTNATPTIAAQPQMIPPFYNPFITPQMMEQFSMNPNAAASTTPAAIYPFYPTPAFSPEQQLAMMNMYGLMMPGMINPSILQANASQIPVVTSPSNSVTNTASPNNSSDEAASASAPTSKKSKSGRKKNKKNKNSSSSSSGDEELAESNNNSTAGASNDTVPTKSKSKKEGKSKRKRDTAAQVEQQQQEQQEEEVEVEVEEIDKKSEVKGKNKESNNNEEKKELTPEEQIKEAKRQRRLMKNRESAQASRERKRIYLENLEKKVSALSAQNVQLCAKVVNLEDENSVLKQKMQRVEEINPEIKKQPDPLPLRMQNPFMIPPAVAAAQTGIWSHFPWNLGTMAMNAKLPLPTRRKAAGAMFIILFAFVLMFKLRDVNDIDNILSNSGVSIVNPSSSTPNVNDINSNSASSQNSEVASIIQQELNRLSDFPQLVIDGRKGRALLCQSMLDESELQESSSLLQESDGSIKDMKLGMKLIDELNSSLEVESVNNTTDNSTETQNANLDQTKRECDDTVMADVTSNLKSDSDIETVRGLCRHLNLILNKLSQETEAAAAPSSTNVEEESKNNVKTEEL